MTPRRLIEPARLAGTALLRTQSDARLVDLVRAGHAAAFEAVVQRYRRPLLRYCERLLPASRAEDAVQQTFLKAYQAMVAGDAELNLRPWLYRIAHNSSLNLLRQNGFGHEQLDENMDGVQRPDQAVELRERLRSTVAAVKALPERQRDALLLREVDGLSYEEIALALGVGDGAVRQLLHRARATLRAGATAVTPVGLLERLASALAAGGDPVARVGELAAGAGAGLGAVKLGAAVLATGAIATGAATGVTLHHQARQAHRSPPAAAAVAPRQAPAPEPPSGGRRPAFAGTLVDDHSRRHGPHSESHERGDDRQRSSSSGPGNSSSPGSSGEHHRSGSGSDDGSHHSGERHGNRGSGSGSGSSGGGSGDPASGGDDHGGGGSPSNDGATTTSGDGGHDGGQILSTPTGTSGSGGGSSGSGSDDHSGSGSDG